MNPLARIRLLGLALATLPLVAACHGQNAAPGVTAPRTATVHLTPAWQSGRLTQAVIAPWSAATVATLDVVPMRWSDSDQAYFPFSKTDGATVSLGSPDQAAVSIAASDLSKGWLAFTNLRPATKYRFQARAVNASNMTVSDPASSSLDLEIGADTEPVMARIPVRLIDRPFAATGSILLRQVSPTKNYDRVLVGLYRPGGIEPIPGATGSFSNCRGTVSLSNLPPNSSFWAKAEAVDASGSILSTATKSLDIADDDQVPAVTLDVQGAPPS